MLPGKWRLQVQNAGLTTDCDVEVKVRGVNVDPSTLKPSYGSWSADLGVANLTSGSFHNTAEQDNETDLYEGLEVEVVLSNFGGTPADAGKVVVRLQGRGDASTEWPDDATGYVAIVFDPDATGTFRKTALVGV